ncbi:MAG: hypothetical protein DRN27_05380 [Thermoplasmata archaeon]|nr:MAG: hypothetical protein DRN27_05380 [Thermoplasmata archaeon]
MNKIITLSLIGLFIINAFGTIGLSYHPTIAVETIETRTIFIDDDIKTSFNIQKNPYFNDIYNQSMFEVFDIVEIGRNSWGLTSADFNDDGYIDFAVASAHTGSNYSTISIFYNDGNKKFTRNDVYSTDFYLRYIKDLDSGDFNDDGDIDLIFTYSEYEYFNEIPVHVYGVTSLLLNDGNDSFSDEEIIARRGSGIPFDPEGRINPQITTGDYDGDGDIDLLVGDNSGIVEFYLNDGSSNFMNDGIIHNFGHSSWGLTSGDFDGDGLIDFVVAALNSDGY